MKWSEKVDWKVKQVLFILCGTLLIITLLFGITYRYFVKKLSVNNEKIVQLTFRQTEKDLKYMMENAQKQLSRFSINELAWEFADNQFSGNARRSRCLQGIVAAFDEMLAANSDAYVFYPEMEEPRYLQRREKAERASLQKESLQSFLKSVNRIIPMCSGYQMGRRPLQRTVPFIAW